MVYPLQLMGLFGFCRLELYIYVQLVVVDTGSLECLLACLRPVTCSSSFPSWSGGLGGAVVRLMIDCYLDSRNQVLWLVLMG